jgi:spermidine/putrescine transport system permease protein
MRVTLPLSMPGTVSAALLVFIPTVGDYVTPALVGGTGGTMIGTAIINLFGKQNDWPLGAAVSVSMMAIVAAAVVLFLWSIGYREMRQRQAA